MSESAKEYEVGQCLALCAVERSERSSESIVEAKIGHEGRKRRRLVWVRSGFISVQLY